MAAAWWVLQQLVNENRNVLRIQRRQLRDAANPFQIPQSQFMSLYRQVKNILIKNIKMLYFIVKYQI